MSTELLLVYAAPVEGREVARTFPDSTVLLGTGKARAAASLAVVLERSRPRVVLSFGVCGAYPADHCRDREAPGLGHTWALWDEQIGLFFDLLESRGLKSAP